MVKYQQNFQMIAGDTHEIRFAIEDEDNNCDPLDITGIDMKWTATADGVTNSIEKTSGAGITVEVGVEGIPNVAVVTLDPADTTGLQGPLAHELYATGPPVVTQAKGTMNVNAANPRS